MSRNTIIYVGGFELPDKNAAAHRVVANGKLLRELGYRVIFYGVNKTLKKLKTSDSELYMGFEYYEVPYPKNISEWFRYLISIGYIKNLTKDLGADSVYGIIAYNYPSAGFYQLLAYCKRRNIKLIADCTEWYVAHSRNFIFNAIKNIDTQLRMRWIQSRCNGIVAISSYLYDFYVKRGNIVVQIPPLVDLEEPKWSLSSEGSGVEFDLRSFLYAASPGSAKGESSKERINEIIETFYYAFEADYKFKLKIIGMTKEQFLIDYPQYEKIIKKMFQNVIFTGKLQHQDVIAQIKRANFFIFFRNYNLVSLAGFPTKLVESISCSTPVLTNDTSNIEDYVTNGCNGFLVKGNNLANIKDTIMYILNLDDEQLLQMKKQCKGQRVFDYRNYIEKMQYFLDKI